MVDFYDLAEKKGMAEICALRQSGRSLNSTSGR